MINQQKEGDRFVIRITAIPQEDDYPLSQFESMNEGVPTEIVLSHLKAFMNNLEQEYFRDFDESAAKFRKE
jgi:hypothetical protein